MDKHLLAENPMSDNGSLAIVRTVQPIAIFEILNGWYVYNAGSEIVKKHYSYVNSDGVKEDYTLKCHHYFSTDIDTPDVNEIYKFMDDAWHWYMAYLKWEDKQIDENN